MLVKGIAVAVLLALLGWAGHYVYTSVWQDGYDAAVAAQDRADKAELIAARKKLHEAERIHDEDQATIARLAADARRVRIHIPACPSSGSNPAGEDGGAGVFSDGVDEAFAAFQREVGNLIERCDQLNIDAIRKNNAEK